MARDFITTIDSDEEVEATGESSRPRRDVKEQDLDPDFEFDFNNEKEGLDLWGGDEVKASNGLEVGHSSSRADRSP
jgi:hypothetical protein